MLKKIVLAAAIAAFIFTGCNRPAETGQRAGAAERITRDRSGFAVSLATPLSAEDAAIWNNISERSRNPDKIILRISTVGRSFDESPPSRSNRQFLIELKRRLGDRIEIQIFYSGILGTTADQILGGLQAGGLFEMVDYNIGAFAEYTNAFMPLDVMFLIPDLESGLKVLLGEPGEIMRQKCVDDTGLLVLVYTNIGMRHMTTSRRPIRSVSDIEGLKIRVQNNPLHILAIRQLGAAPTPIAFAELFTALQQGVVDGQENPISNIWDQNYMEVQNFLTFTNHLFTAGTLTVNNTWFNRLSPEVQKIFWESAKIAEEYTAKELTKVEQGLIQEISKAMELIELPPQEFNRFREISIQTWGEAAERIGRDYFERVRASIERTLAN